MWGLNANCYAYACGCQNPVGPLGGSTPGAWAKAQVNKAPNESVWAYSKRLVQGVIDDGQVQGVPIREMGGFGVAREVPNVPPGYYLIALLVKTDGFHFLRRNADGHWSWKEGALGEETQAAYSVRDGGNVQITDANIAGLVATDCANYAPNWQAFGFAAYLLVRDGGMNVRRA